jgi:hypothetical protein
MQQSATMVPHRRGPLELPGLDPAALLGRGEAGCGEVRRPVEAGRVRVGVAAVVVAAVGAGAAVAVVETVGAGVELVLVVLPLIGNWLSSC